MKIKTSELQGAALDWAVAKCEGKILSGGPFNGNPKGSRFGYEVHDDSAQFGRGYEYWAPSTNWAQGGPIVEREGINLVKVGIALWRASLQNYGGHEQHDNAPLIAAMRCYVASKLGNVVDVPDELTV